MVGIANFVAEILQKDGFRTELLGLGRDPVLLWNTLRTKRPALVFNLFEGSLDDTETESYVAGLLEWSGIPYTGSPPQALSLARAKHTTKMVLKSAGVPTAPFMVVHQLPVPACKLKWPVIVKAAKQDASVGMEQKSVCTNQKQLEDRVAYVLDTYGSPVLVEEFRRVTIPTNAIQAIDISAGRTHRRSTIKGALIGAVAIGGLFGATNMPEINPKFSDFVDGAAVGLAVGAVAGGIVGYLLGGEKWRSFYRAGVLPP